MNTPSLIVTNGMSASLIKGVFTYNEIQTEIKN